MQRGGEAEVGDSRSGAVSKSCVIVDCGLWVVRRLGRQYVEYNTISIVCTVHSVTSMRASFGGDLFCRNMTSGRFEQVRGKK